MKYTVIRHPPSSLPPVATSPSHRGRLGLRVSGRRPRPFPYPAGPFFPFVAK